MKNIVKNTIVNSLPVRHYANIKRALFKLSNSEEYKKSEYEKTSLDESSYTLKPFIDTKSIYVHIPKCAGMSINTSLYNSPAGGHRGLSTYLYLFDYEDFSNYFKFTFVRNPWDRLVSSYTFLNNGGLNSADNNWFQSNLGKYNDFNQFVQEWLNKANIQSYHHFKPQIDYIYDAHQKVSLDFIGRFENLESDFNKVASKLNIQAKLAKVNSSPRGSYRRFYNDKTAAIVYEVYKEDIEMLGYEF